MRLKPVQINVLFALLIITAPGFAQEYQRPTTVIVRTDAAAEAQVSSVAGVLDNTVRLHVGLAGYRIIEPESVEPDYIILSEYAVNGSVITITISAETAKTSETAARTSWSGALDLDLDEQIGAVLNRDIFPVLPVTVAENRRTTEKAAEAGEEWAVAALDIASDAESGSASDDSSGGTPGGWELDILGSIYVPTSDAATFASFGYGGRLAFGYGFGRNVIVAPRIIVGALWLPTDTLTDTDLLLVPGGVEMKIGSSSAGFISPYVRLGGGVSGLIIFPDGGSTTGKIVPYGEVAIGMDFRISNVFHLVLDVSFSGQFEETVTLWGLSPAFGMGLRF